MNKYLELRDFTYDDFAFISPEIKNPKELMLWAGPKYVFPLSWEQMNKKMNEEDEDGHKKTKLFTAFEGSSKFVLGHGQLTITDKIEKIAIVGSVLVFSKYRGQGYGNALIRSLMNFGFINMRMNELRLRVFDFNFHAIKCYKQVGFIETSFEESAIEVDGEKLNLITMNKLKQDFEEEQKKGRPWPEESQNYSL